MHRNMLYFPFLYIIFCMILSCLNISPLFSQQSPLHISYLRQNNVTYTGNYALNYQKRWKKYRIETLSRHDHLLNTQRTSPFVQANFHTDIWQYYQFTPKWAAVSWAEGDQFITNKTQRYSIYLGAEYQYKEYLKITPLFGYSWDQLTNIWNHGFSPALRLYSTYTWADGLKMETKLMARAKFISPRNQRNISFSSQWNKSFEGKGEILLGAVVGSNETDNFKSKSIERIQSDSICPSLMIHYEPFKNLVIETQNQYLFSLRRFNYKGDSAEFNNLRFSQSDVLLHQQATYRSKKWDISFAYNYEFGQRRYNVENSLNLQSIEYQKLKDRELQKDFTRSTQHFELNLNFKPTQKQTFSLTGNNRYTQYDTPSETNFDDHDELNYGLAAQWEANWQTAFYTRYKLEGNRRQYAFLFKEKSQDNYSQYVLRAEFEHLWRFHPKWQFQGEQSVYVTYNVKDFRDINFTDRSTRNLETRLSLRYNAKEKRQHFLSFYRKETHLSYLNWQEFSETTLDTTYSMSLEQKNTFRLFQKNEKGSLWFDAGYKHFYLYRYQNTAMYDFQNIFRPINLHILNFQTGPVTSIRWLGKKRNNYDCSFWWQYQQQYYDYQIINQFTTFQSNYKEVDLQKITRYFRPFMDIKVDLFF